MKLLYGTFAAFLLIISYLGIHMPDSDLQWLLTSSSFQTYGRVIFALALLWVAVFWHMRTLPVRLLFGGLGVAFLVTSISGLFFTSLLGVVPVSVLPLDFLIMTEGGILALLAALELDPGLTPADQAVRLDYAQALEEAERRPVLAAGYKIANQQ